jgi:DNA-binding transcriptional MerR regulator
MLFPEFTLQELCDAAGVSTRTVRYYISQGLLASPDRRGPGATYRAEHLDRLQLIRRLKDRHLPLSKIRELLDGMSDEDIRAGKIPDLNPDPDSAYSYVQQVLHAKEPPPDPDIPKLFAKELAALDQRFPDLMKQVTAMAEPIEKRMHTMHAMRATRSKPAPKKPAKTTTPTRSTWEHHTITDNIELHIRRPLSRDDDRRVQELLAEAHRRFRKEDP